MSIQAETLNRRCEIQVGDLIQYRYSYGPKGFTSWSITTRTVIEVVDGGAAFVVEGLFNVPARCVITHIPIDPAEGEEFKDELESAYV